MVHEIFDYGTTGNEGVHSLYGGPSPTSRVVGRPLFYSFNSSRVGNSSQRVSLQPQDSFLSPLD